MKTNLWIFAPVLSAVLLLVSCSPPIPLTKSPLPTPGPKLVSPLQAPAQAQIPPAPVDAPEPSPGKASISGLIYSYTIKKVVPETLYYLTPAVGPDKRQMPDLLIGPEESTGDVQSATGKQGEFTLNNIPPGNYYLIVWAPPYSWSVAETAPTDQTPRMIHLEPGDRDVLGTVYVGWP